MNCRSVIMVAASATNTTKTTTTTTTATNNTITLRAGVLLNAPYADYNETTGMFSGFEIDALEHMKIFATQQGYTLDLELELLELTYGDALDLIANDCNTTTNPSPYEDCQKYDLIIGDYFVNDGT